MVPEDGPEDTVKVWDPLIRIFHWSLVLTFTIAYITEDDWQSLHLVAGYAVTILIAFRLVWGVIGPRFARFTQFIKSPAGVLFSSLLEGQNLTRAMITGRKKHINNAVDL